MKTPLGQNFLTNELIARKIAASADIQGANVLEVGPGKGILTKYLAQFAGKILAVEIDKKLAMNLEVETPRWGISRSFQETLRRSVSTMRIIQGDILKINLPKIIEENNFQNYKAVANLPYYITSKIIRLFLETKYPPAEMILMVQKEVGERIVASDGKESLLSISVKFYADSEILFEVGRDNFEPIPEVDSVVIRIRRKRNIPDINIKKFFSLVRTGFSSKRKKLANNLLSHLQATRVELLSVFEKAGLAPDVRAEKLTLGDWIKLYNNFLFK